MINKTEKVNEKNIWTGFGGRRLTALILLSIIPIFIFGQTEPPAPSAPASVKIPAVIEKTLPNKLKVAVIERKNVPLVTVQVLFKSGAEMEEAEKAGLADMTASLLTKGTKSRTATQIAEQIEFLGATINTGASWNNSVMTVNVMSEKLDPAMAIMADALLNPIFKKDEIDLLRSQTLDGLAYNLTQPGYLANYVAAKYSFNEHPAGGTPDTIKSISRDDIVNFHKENYSPDNAVLIFTGDISADKAAALAQKYFGQWKNPKASSETELKLDEASMEYKEGEKTGKNAMSTVKRILVIDLPNSGQAAVSYTKNLQNGRADFTDDDKILVNKNYYPSIVLNSLLGGGYSSRLNQEIRIKRGLSYGAGSGFNWRLGSSNFGTRTQTKNESAAEVAELVVTEVNKLSEGKIPEVELNPRKMVLTGSFGRSLETTDGLAGAIADLYSFDLPTDELNSFMKKVQSVTEDQIKHYAGENFKGGDIIIVGDYSKFKEDLAKRFPGIKVEVIPAGELDLSSESLRKSANSAAKNGMDKN